MLEKNLVQEDTVLRPEDRRDIEFLVDEYYAPQDDGGQTGYGYVHTLHWYMVKLLATVRELEAARG